MNDRNGYTLYLVLVILSISSVLFSIYMYTIRDTNRAVTGELQTLRAQLLAESGIERARYFLSGAEGRDEFWETDSFHEEVPPYGFINLSCQRWGGYSLVRSIGTAQRYSKSETAVLGGKIPDLVNAAVTLTGKMQNLVLDDNAKIEGTVCLYSGSVLQGPKKERIRGSQSWTVNRLSPPLPFDCSPLIELVKKYKLEISNAVGYPVATELINQSNSQNISLKPQKQRIKGNYIFRDVSVSNVDIIIEGSAIIENGAIISNSIIKAKNCFIRGGVSDKSIFYAMDSMHLFEGRHSSQFFSDGKIISDKNFDYRSGAFIFSYRTVKPDSTLKGGVYFSEGSSFTGHVICFEDTSHGVGFIKKTPGIIIDNKSEISGSVFSNGTVSIAHSNLTGRIWAEMISVQKEKSTYNNWFLGTMVRSGEENMPSFPNLN